jgi:3-deoxy-D-manno-octulosonic-acid transferase
MIRFIYNLLWPLALLFFLPGYVLKMFRRGGYRAKFGQRLGWYGDDLRRRLSERRSTWLHAVSVGEVAIALKLARALRILESDLHCVLTVTTTTGFAFANNNAPPWIEVMYTPLDFWPVMQRAFAVIRPTRILLVEAEVWPNLVAAAHARRIPIALVNARLSPRSEKRFRQFRFFIRPTFRLLDLVCAQESEDTQRWATIGVPRDRIRVVGSIKYDLEDAVVDPTGLERVLRDHRIDNDRPILLGGSTHRGEEEVLAGIFREVRGQFPDLFLIIAPRHAERAGEIRRPLEGAGLRVALRSEAPSIDSSIDCLLLDSTGELRNWYALATVVFMGKSLLAHGGQNPAEAIAAGKPIVFGPHMENFAALTRTLVAKGGAIEIDSVAELKQAIVDLLRDSGYRAKLVQNARMVLQTHRDATIRSAKLIINLRPGLESERGNLPCA